MDVTVQYILTFRTTRSLGRGEKRKEGRAGRCVCIRGFISYLAYLTTLSPLHKLQKSESDVDFKGWIKK
jgi:hypothetical protein